MAEEEQGNNFSFSLNSVNNANVRLEDVRELENDNFVEIKPDVESDSGRGRGRGRTRDAKQKGGNNNRGAPKGSLSLNLAVVG